MIGKIFITSTGYDPDSGNLVKDPYLDGIPSLGACRPDIRRSLKPDDYIFTITGKLPVRPAINQYIMSGFQVAEKIDASEAYVRFPDQRLKLNESGQLYGNVIVDADGNKHSLDQHPEGEKFERRIKDFIVGKNLIMPESPSEIALAREETMDTLCRVIGKRGRKPFDLIGRAAKKLDEKQIEILLGWLQGIKEQKIRKESSK